LAGKKEDPAFIAIIPANVRYDKNLNPNAKLLYGELTALSRKEGYAWASNNYFANLYQVDRSSISRWIKSLHDAGYIKIEFIYDKANRYVEERRIYITAFTPENPIKETIPADPESDPQGGGAIMQQGGAKIHQGVVQNCNRGGVKMSQRSLQANNTEAAAADQIAEKPEKPPPETAADFDEMINDLKSGGVFENSDKSVNDLKLHFKNLSLSLIFDENFYPKAVSYLSLYKLDFKFVSWMYEFCLKKEPKNLSGYFFKIFFESRYVELYRSQPPPVEKPLFTFKCPVCSTEHDSSLSECPVCGLNSSGRHNQEQINLKKRFYDLPPDLKDAYEQEFNSLHESTKHFDFRERRTQLENLDRKYGLIDTC
jgi:hypothetical protein